MILVMIGVMLMMVATVSADDLVPARPTVGAIRWDAWSGGEVTRQVERTLAPAQYRPRLPWFAEVLADETVRIHGGRQEIMDQEIRYAVQAGLDYWAFLLYPEPNSMSDALRLYLRSTARGQINFCLILHNAFGVPDAQWPRERDRAVALLREPGYQTVCGGRPLVYVFQLQYQKVFPRERFAEFRQAARAHGIDPYCVYMGWNPATDFQQMAPLGFDAVSHYARGSDDPTYAKLCARVEDSFWRQAATAGVPYVPLVTTGWEKNPRKDHPVSWEVNQSYHHQAVFPTIARPAEITAHLRSALQFVRDHPRLCPANTLITYAWNEHDEGGWLCPTWTPEGIPNTERIDALAAVLSAGQKPLDPKQPAAEGR